MKCDKNNEKKIFGNYDKMHIIIFHLQQVHKKHSDIKSTSYFGL